MEAYSLSCMTIECIVPYRKDETAKISHIVWICFRWRAGFNVGRRMRSHMLFKGRRGS